MKDYDEYDNLPRRPKRGRSEGEKRSAATRILKQTQWLSLSLFYWERRIWNKRTNFDFVEILSLDLPLWLVPFRVIIRLKRHRSGLYAIKLSIDEFYRNLTKKYLKRNSYSSSRLITPLDSSGQNELFFDERNLFVQDVIPINENLLKKTALIIPFTSRFPKIFPALVGDVKKWQKKQEGLLKQARLRLQLCREYMLARMIYAIPPSEAKFLEEYKTKKDQLYQMVNNPEIPEELRISANLLLARFSPNHQLPKKYRYLSHIIADIPLNLLWIAVNVISKYDIPEVLYLFEEEPNDFLAQIVEDAYLFSLIAGKNKKYLLNQILFLQHNLQYMKKLGKFLFWVFYRLHLLGFSTEKIEPELMNFISSYIYQKKERRKFIRNIFINIFPEEKSLTGLMWFLRKKKSVASNFHDSIIWGLYLNVIQKMNRDEVEFFSANSKEIILFIKNFSKEHKYYDNSTDFFSHLFKMYQILREEDLVEIFIQYKVYFSKIEYFKIWGKYPEYFRRCVQVFKHVVFSIPIEDLSDDFMEIFLRLLDTLLFKEEFKWTDLDWKYLEIIVSKLLQIEKNYDNLSMIKSFFLEKDINDRLKNTEKLQFWDKILSVLLKNDYTNLDYIEGLHDVFSFLIIIYGSEWKKIIRTFEIATEIYQKQLIRIDFIEINFWLKTYIKDKYIFDYIKKILVLKAYFGQVMYIFGEFSNIPEHFQPKLQIFIKAWALPEIPSHLPAELLTLLDPKDVDSVLRLMGYQKLIHGKFALPDRLSRIVNFPKTIKNELVFLEEKAKKGEITPLQEKRMQYLHNQIKDASNLRLVLQKRIKKELKRLEISLPFEALKHQWEKFLEIWWHSRFMNLPAPGNPEYLQNLLILLEYIDRNKRLLKKIIRLYVQGENIYEHFPGNQKFLKDFEKNKGNVNGWLTPYRKEFHFKNDVWTIYVSEDPLEIFMMGTYFLTCLAPTETNNFSVVANAAEINKKVIFIRNKKGIAIARKLIAMSKNHRLLYGFHNYSHLNPDNGKIWIDILFDLAMLEIADKSHAIVKIEKNQYLLEGIIGEEFFCDVHKMKEFIFFDKDKNKEYRFEKYFTLFSKWYYDDYKAPDDILYPCPVAFFREVYSSRDRAMSELKKMLFYLLERINIKELAKYRMFYRCFVWMEEKVIPFFDELIKQRQDGNMLEFLKRLKPILIGNARTFELERKLREKFKEWLKE